MRKLKPNFDTNKENQFQAVLQEIKKYKSENQMNSVSSVKNNSLTDEERQTEEELTGPNKKMGFFKSYQWHKDHPGYKVTVIMFILYYTFVLAGIYSFIGRREIGALHLLVLVIGAIPAGILTHITWNIIGETARNILRFLAYHWFLTLIFIGFLNMVIVGTRKGVPLSNILKAQGLMVGNNWQVPVDQKGRYLKLLYNEALVYCQSLGAEWRLLSSKELDLLDPAFVGHEKKNFWLSDPVDRNQFMSQLIVSEKNKNLSLTKGLIMTSTNTKMPIVCYKDKK